MPPRTSSLTRQPTHRCNTHPERVSARPRRWHKAFGWLPVALLLAGVSNHFWQVQHHQLSPWLGAGFGMFATTDLDSARQVYLSALLADGSEQEITLGEPYLDTLNRARALPSEAWLARLADATFQALEATPESQFPAAPLTLRVDVWRLSYQADTLGPSAALVAGASYPFPDNDH